MKKIKLLTMALLPITTLGATIGMASCSTTIVQPPIVEPPVVQPPVAPPTETTLPIIDNEKDLKESSEKILKDYEKLLAININNKFKDNIDLKEKIKNHLEKNIHEGSKVKWVKIDQVEKYNIKPRIIKGDKTNPSVGFIWVKFQLEARVIANQYSISYAVEGEDFHRGRVVDISFAIKEIILECMYQHVGMEK